MLGQEQEPYAKKQWPFSTRHNQIVRGFHDSVITRFEVSKGRLEVKIESVWVADDEPREAGLLVVETVDSLLEDEVDRSTDSTAFGLDDGQILTLTMDETAVKMTVECNSKPRPHYRNTAACG